MELKYELIETNDLTDSLTKYLPNRLTFLNKNIHIPLAYIDETLNLVTAEPMNSLYKCSIGALRYLNIITKSACNY